MELKIVKENKLIYGIDTVNLIEWKKLKERCEYFVLMSTKIFQRNYDIFQMFLPTKDKEKFVLLQMVVQNNHPQLYIKVAQRKTDKMSIHPKNKAEIYISKDVYAYDLWMNKDNEYYKKISTKIYFELINICKNKIK